MKKMLRIILWWKYPNLWIITRIWKTGNLRKKLNRNIKMIFKKWSSSMNPVFRKLYSFIKNIISHFLNKLCSLKSTNSKKRKSKRLMKKINFYQMTVNNPKNSFQRPSTLSLMLGKPLYIWNIHPFLLKLIAVKFEKTLCCIWMKRLIYRLKMNVFKEWNFYF